MPAGPEYAEPDPFCPRREAAAHPILAERLRILAGQIGVAGMVSDCGADRYTD
jgi:hypothetical protein